MALAAVSLCLTLALPILLFPAVTATVQTEQSGPSSSKRLLTEVSPAALRMITKKHLLERERGAQGQLPEQEQEAAAIYYWRYVWALCMVKNNFSPYKVDWYYWSWEYWGTSELDKDYLGDCHFYVEYGADYYGDYGGEVTMADDKTITDQWKKGMSFNSGPDDLTQPYYWVVKPTPWDCSDDSLSSDVRNDYCEGKPATDFAKCNDLDGSYDATTGLFTTTIGYTDAKRWVCGVRMELLTRAGADLTVLSPKPGASYSITPKTKPAQIPDTQYELRIDMKGFGIKSPALPKQSSWAKTYLWLEGSGWQTRKDAGMWIDHIDPYYYDHWWSGPFISGHEPDWCMPDEGYGCYGGAQWYLHNTWNNWQEPDPDLYRWPPATPKALFPPSSVTLKYVQSDHTMEDGWVLYDFGVEIEYIYKRISFITGDDVAFSGNPTNVRASHQGRNVQWDLTLSGTYPEVEYY